VKRISSESQLIGFLNGPHGVMHGVYCEINDAMMNIYRNTGGFDMIASGRDKIEKEEQFVASENVVTALDLDGLIVIGGDDSNTNAALLAERFKSKGLKCKVIGCPKTIDGDLKNEYIPISFGFDTACKTFSEQIGNVMSDVLSTQNYFDFVRLMGRSAANIALECALMTRPNLCFIGEEVQANKASLAQVTDEVVTLVLERAAVGKNYGVILLPEGLIEFIPEFEELIKEINDLLAHGATVENCPDQLTTSSRAVFDLVPPAIQMQLMLDRDPHGNVQVAKIETEKLIAGAVAAELEKKAKQGLYNGLFKAEYHSFGYEGRCSIPSLFDANYCYALGYNAGALLSLGETGMMSSIRNLDAPISEWVCGGVPTTMMMNIERRHGEDKPVIMKALVDMNGRPFQLFSTNRQHWRLNDVYRIPGPIQFGGPGSDEITYTLHYELTPEPGRYLVNVSSPPAEAKGDYLFVPSGEDQMSTVQNQRRSYMPQVPACLASRDISKSVIVCGVEVSHESAVNTLLPNSAGGPILGAFTVDVGSEAKVKLASTEPPSQLTVGVAFCGTPGSGVLSLLQGLHEYASGFGDSSIVVFIGGVVGMKAGQAITITPEILALCSGQGGTAPFASSTERISPTDIPQVQATCEKYNLNSLVLVGASDAATDAAFLTEHFRTNLVPIKVLSVPSCSGMSLCNTFVEAPLGADTACKTISQLSGNLAIDGASARKYWYFMTVDGNGSSFSTLEAAIQSNPNMAILNEDYDGTGLQRIVQDVADCVARRAAAGNNFGTLLIAKGLAEGAELAALVKAELSQRKKAGSFSGKFDPVCFDFGLQVRSGLPSCFDIDYGFTLGATCAVLLKHNVSGYMPIISGLKNPTEDWSVGAVPIVAMMKLVDGNLRVPISPIDAQCSSLAFWNSIKSEAETKEVYMNPGPVQFHSVTATHRMKVLQLEAACYLP